MFHADLHIHSRFSRACSKDCDLEHLAWWALRKGVTVVGTGDFTHPGWAEELSVNLVPAEPGLFRLRPDLEKRVRRASPPGSQPVRFMLSVEISTIYRRAERTRKVHHLLYAPTLEAAGRITAALARIGNLASDGRPILGLDSRDLLEITLESDPGSYLIPAHVWTPWFAVLGSKSGFDAIADCYADLAGHVFAIETGLSSDPPMNWMCSVLDSYRLVSNSDAHSPPMLGREATALCTDLDYFAIRKAFETGDGLAGTIEFFPEEGKYHLDGHRKCAVRLTPAQTLLHGGNCPECRKPLTVGVLHRVEELSDRPRGFRPEGAPDCWNLVQLPQVVSEILGTGPKSKKVAAEVGRLVASLGPELAILREVPAGEIARAGGTLLGEAISRLRRGEVLTEAGYDGEYGTIRLLQPCEVKRESNVPALFEAVAPAEPAARTGKAGPAEPAGRGERAERAAVPPNGRKDHKDSERLPRGAPLAAQAGGPGGRPPGLAEPERLPRGAPLAAGEDDPGRRDLDEEPGGTGSVLSGLDPEQRVAAAADGPVLIVAGPGTGKTRALTRRIAHLVAERGVAPARCLAITFTRRAAQELRDRLAVLIPAQAAQVTVTTFHGLGLQILREQHGRTGLPEHFGVADEAARLAVAAELTGSERDGRALLAEIARAGQDQAGDPVPAAEGSGAGGIEPPGPAGEFGAVPQRDAFRKALLARGLVDFDGLVELAGHLLRDQPDLAAMYRQRWPQISVDEYQDADHAQYALLKLLTRPDGAGLAVIGDPDQAIYGFRGADVRLFLRFTADYPAAATAVLSRNYRSGPAIVEGARQAIAPATLVPGRELRAVKPASRGAASRDAVSRDDELIMLHEAADEHAEAAWIAAAIDGLLGGSSFHSLDSGRADGYGHAGLGLGDIAVLHRTDAQAGPLLQAFTRAGLPCQKRSHDRLANRPGVHIIVRQLQLAGSGPSTDHGAGSVEARLRAAVRALTGMLPSAGAEAADARAAGEVLLPLARRCGDDLGRFLTEISLDAEADAADPRADSVGLLTLHAAKGLEFEVVFVAGCEDGLLPLWFPGAANGGGRDDAEERRLFFVGMTRARSRLFLTSARRRTRWGAEREAEPSSFLAALSPEVTTRAGALPHRRPSGRQLRLL